MSDVVTPADLVSWVSGLDDLFARVAGRFGRIEPRRQARAYLIGLLAPVERKNSWQLAEAAGDASPDRMQRLLRSARWDPDAVRDDLRAYVRDELGHRDGVLVVDESGFLKQGNQSAGVQRQYSGTAGRVENCQLGVFCGYTSPRGRALIDRELYLPASWTDDPDRMASAGVPDEVRFATKPQLAARMIARALAAGVPAQWVTADEAYGHDGKFRQALAQQNVGYVVAIPRSQPIPAGLGPRLRADTLVAQAPLKAWKRLSCGDGSKGPRTFDWALASLPDADYHLDGSRWLLVRRSVSDPEDLAFYLCAGPSKTNLATLVAVAGARWSIEDCFKQAKGETGLDQYQVRRYDGWYRHITLSMLAYAYLAVTAAGHPKATPVSASLSARARSAVSWHT